MTRKSHKTRADDDLLLERVSLRCEGVSAKDVADLHGIPRNTVLSSTFAVIKADEAHDPKDFDRSAYW